MAPAQEGFGADTSDGAGKISGAAVLRATQRGQAGQVNGGGVGSLVSHPRARGEGGPGELPASAAGCARTGAQRRRAAFNPTTALDGNGTSNLKRQKDEENVREERGR